MNNLLRYKEKKLAIVSIQSALLLPVDYAWFFMKQTAEQLDLNYTTEELCGLRKTAKQQVIHQGRKPDLVNIYALVDHLTEGSDLAQKEKEYCKSHYLYHKRILGFLRDFAGAIVLLNDTSMSKEELCEVLGGRFRELDYRLTDFYDPGQIEKIIEEHGVTCEDTLFLCDQNRMIPENLEKLAVFHPYEDTRKSLYEALYMNGQANPLFAALCAYLSSLEGEQFDKEPLLEFGAALMGPLLVTYAEFVVHYAQSHQIRQICPLLRDGYIMNKLIRRILIHHHIDDISVVPLHVSRRALSKVTKMRKEYLSEQEVYALKRNRMSVRAYLQNMGVDAQEFKECDLNFEEAERKTGNNGKTVLECLKTFIMEKRTCFDKEQNADLDLIYGYLDGRVQLDEDILTVDFGFAGSIGGKLATVTELKGRKGKIHNLLLCGSKRQNEVLVSGNEVKAFLYNMGIDAAAYQNSNFIYTIFENYMMGEEGSTIGYLQSDAKHVTPVLEEESAVDVQKNRLCYQGIEMYLNCWEEMKKDCPDLIHMAFSQREVLSRMIERLLFFPTEREARTLGDTKVENKYLGYESFRPIVDDELLRTLETEGFSDYLVKESRSKTRWFAGAYSQGFADQVLIHLIRYSHRDSHYIAMADALEACLTAGVKDVVIYGLGLKGRILHRLLMACEINVSAIIDNNINLKGNRYHGIPIVPSDAFQNTGSRFIITSCIYYSEIYEELRRRYGAERIIDWYGQERTKTKQS